MGKPHTVMRTFAWLLAGLLLTACAACDGDAKASAGALAAARTYVDAIAVLDLGTADRMTAPDQRTTDSPDLPVDVTDALPDATDPITDPWVTALGPGDEAGTYAFNVSYRIKSLTGGGTIVLRQATGSDPSEVSSWTVVLPLTQYVDTFADRTTVATARVGNVEVTGYDNEGFQKLWGYPGGYLLKADTDRKDITPLWFALGADDLPPWNVDLPELGPKSDH
jgi:hypothetical protein